MIGRVQISIHLDPETLAAIDTDRGQIPRSTYLNDLLRYVFVEPIYETESISAC